jgi:hypothetical protein
VFDFWGKINILGVLLKGKCYVWSIIASSLRTAPFLKVVTLSLNRLPGIHPAS